MPNPQLTMYGAAGLRQYEITGDFKRVRTVIVQPRLNHISERVQTIAEIEEFIADVAFAAAACAEPDAPRVPSAKGCRWCRAKATCPALVQEALVTIQGATSAPVTADDFDDLHPVKPSADTSDDYLANAMAKADLIEGWIKAVRAEVERRLLSGGHVDGYKLVQGKRGHRKWSNAAEAEALLKSMRLKESEMYDFSLISPTTADKLAAAKVIGPCQWPRLQQLITQSEGGPSVAPETDKRPAMVVTSASASDFDDVTSPT
jgi:Protein of unknown function (DUF2800)